MVDLGADVRVEIDLNGDNLADMMLLVLSDQLGTWNFGGYSNARIDEMLPAIQSEIDEARRQAMLDEAAAILQDEMAYVTLYVQPLLWGTRANIELTQRPDDFLILRWVTVN